ncbi:hypothetical protein [Siphonobacter sp. SORGH_AS_0500]|uniref:hypothetical protein n=1 Tax=Siphonobacter sp. SORGH_AS_0500 TaxID=1864824 RepID=UPI0028590986|nr:hypothetical protein [Siphonobacter sp. SORGH_AS_0500]MDR6193343.1 thymidylate kinase [Siphonobacter sp. SORGH_AS_0500]
MNIELSNKTIAFEGMPGSGKSSVLSRIVSKFRTIHSIDVIDQTIVDENIVHLDVLERSKKFILAEIAKNESIIFDQNNYRFFLLDRCYISLIAYQYSLAKTFSSYISNKAYNLIRHSIINLIAEGKLIEPSLLIVFITSPSISIDRRKNYLFDQDNEIWFNSLFLQNMYDFYTQELYSEYFTNKSKFIITNDVSIDCVEKAVIKCLNL